MRRLLKYAALIVMVLMMSGSAWAYNYTDHVTTAPNNKGDVLIYPYFLALDGGWETKLTVVNTDETNSVVAKVVIRSFKNSEELLDFFIYLTPADVWIGKMMVDPVTKRVVIDSTDDSVLGSTSGITSTTIKWADTVGNALHQVMFPLNCSDDGDYLGYIEIITAAIGDMSKSGQTAPVSIHSKPQLWAEYELFKASKGILKKPYDFTTKNANVLAGWMQVQNSIIGLSASLKATTLKDYDNDTVLGTAAETRLGQYARNNLIEVEAALSKDDIAMPYVNDKDLSLHIFTFPTKLTTTDKGCGLDKKKADGPYFQQYLASPNYYCVPYKVKIYDLKENTPTGGSPFSGGDTTIRVFCDEVNLLGTGAFYPEGWAHYYFENAEVFGLTVAQKSLGYLGTPVLPTYLYVGATGLSANYGAWTDDLVNCQYSVGTSTSGYLPDYQYTDFIDCQLMPT